MYCGRVENSSRGTLEFMLILDAVLLVVGMVVILIVSTAQVLKTILAGENFDNP